jgi:hypothetical protein
LDKGIEIYTKFEDLKYSYFRRFDPLLRYNHAHVNVEGFFLKLAVACEGKFERVGWYSFELKTQQYTGYTLLDPRIDKLLAAHERYQGEERLITLV